MAARGILGGYRGSGRRRGSLRRSAGIILIPLVLLSLVLTGEAAGVTGAARPSAEDAVKVLRRIRAEVSALGKHPADDVLTWMFHLGPADDDTNQDEHVAVVVQDIGSRARMTIQVTELEPSPRNPNIRHGRSSRRIVCDFRGDAVEISRSDYPDRELGKKLDRILEAVLNKKRLLKLGGRNTQCT